MDGSNARSKLDAFFASGKLLRYSKRGVILGYGETTDQAYWITKGRVMVVSCNSDGIERIQHIYEEKEVFPVKIIFERTMPDIAFLAFSELELRSRPIGEFLQFIEQEPDVMVAIIQQQLAVTDDLINLHYETAEERVAFRLQTLAKRFARRGTTRTIVSCPITIQELASTVHVSRETTGKILKKLAAQGMVALRRQNILVDTIKLGELLRATSA